mgnify:CR=1 FL=1
MEDVEIINLLWQREEMGLLELERKYRAYCNAIAMNILQSAEDAEECVSDTWMKIWNSIPPNRPESLKLYAARIMRNLAFNRYRDARAERRGGGQPCAPLKELSECISEQSVDEALNRMLFGMERPNDGEQKAERELTAAHEAGHALLTALLLPESQIRRVSIIPTGKGAAGYSMAIPPEKLFHRRQELLHHMAVALAGREAEALYLGGYEQISNGASNDIEKAALLCQRMVCEWGMLPAGDEPYLFSQGQREAAQQQWLSMARQLAASLLRQQEAAWRRLTEALLEKEALDGEEVRQCLKKMA